MNKKMPKSTVSSWNESVDGPVSESAMRMKIELLGYSVHRYVYAPGTMFPEHTHGVDKIDGVVSGCFQIVLEGTAHDLRAGDWIVVPAEALHSAKVIGHEPVISLDGVRKK